MNKISKGKAVGLLSLGLASVALGSVGFASWVISATSVTGDSNVTVAVGQVSDQRIDIKAVLSTEDPSVTLDADSTKNTNPIKGVGSTKEDLTFKVDVTGKKGAEYAGGDTYNCKFEVVFPGSLSAGLVTVESVKNGDATVDNYATGFPVPVSTGGTKTTYTFTLKWDTKFGGKNPADLTQEEINNLDGGIDGVIANLRTVKDALNGKQITVTLSSATPAA